MTEETPNPPVATSSTIITILQNMVTALNGLGMTRQTASLNFILVVTPSNANAAAAGVAIGQQYRDGADPSRVYVRTA